MGLWNRLTGEGLSAVAWDGAAPAGLLVHPAVPSGTDLKTGTRLTVPAGWCVVLAAAGRVADVVPAGEYTLDPKAVAALLGREAEGPWTHATFRADVFYVSARRWARVGWAVRGGAGTGNRSQIQGTCGFRVTDPGRLISALARPGVPVEDYPAGNLRNLIANQFLDWLRSSGGELTADAGPRVAAAQSALAAEFAKMGVDVSEFTVEGVAPVPDLPSPPSERRGSSGVLSFSPHRPTPTPTPANGAVDELGPDRPPSSGPPSARLPLAETPSDPISSFAPPIAAPRSGRILLPEPADAADPPLLGFGMAGPLSSRLTFGDTPLPPEPPRAAAPAAPSFHVAANGATTGPFDSQSLAEKVRAGEIAP
ncbi:MAG: SPFH domain-containing protein, partial [Fimbriiglobus sp.]